VADVQGGVIQGATVTVTNTATTIARTVTTDAGGRYQVGQLIPGPYTVSAEATGFKKTLLSGITLQIAQTLSENVTVQVGDAKGEVVNVTAEPLTTDTESSSVGAVIDGAKVEELPLANRQFYELAQIAPGVVPPAQASTLGFRGGFNVNGAPETDNQFLVNGTFNNDMGTNQPSFRPSVETIAEFKILSGVYSADYGRFAGGQIVMVTKQGTNKFHGSAYEFIRNGAIEAKPWSPTPQTLTPAFKQNTFGATIGGPAIRDKAFFFFGYEGQRIRQQIVAASTVPTAAIVGGCLPSSSQLYNPFTGALLTQLTTAPSTGGCAGIAPATTSTGAIIPEYDITQISDASGVNLWTTPSAQLGRLLTTLAYPLPNTNISAANVVPSNNYNFSETRQETMDEYNTRGDFKYSEKDSFSGTFNYFHDPSFEPENSLCSSRTLPNFGCFTNQLSTLANVGEIHIFKPTLLNDVRFGFSRLVQPRIQQDNTSIGSVWPGLPGQLGQTAVPNNYGVPSIAVTNFTSTGGQTNLPQDRWTNHFQFTDAITWIHGPHTFKFGFDMTDVKSTEYEVTTGRGSVTFSNSAGNTNNGNPTSASSPHFGTTEYAMGDMLLGIPSSSAVTPTALPYTYNRFTSFDLYAMDDWKVTPNLTLNLGVRYEIDSPVSEKYGNISTFVPATQSFLLASQAGVKNLYQTDRNNFAPRVGFAWQPFQNDKTVVKGAFGVFYQEPILYNEFLSYSLQYPVRYPRSFTSGAVSQTTKTVAGSATTLTLNNPFNSADIPTPGETYCTSGTSGCVITNCATGVSAPCPLTPVITGTAIAPNYATPYWDEWSLSIQRQLNRTTLIEVGYYGSKGSRISESSILNYNNSGPSASKTSITQAQRVYPEWGNISYHKTGGNSEYESLPVRLEERTKSGASILVSYTYGKSLDETTAAQNPDPFYVDPNTGLAGNQKGDRGLSAFNVKHRLVVSPVYPLPFGKGQAWLNNGGLASALAGGWKLSGVFQYFTGRPFATTDSSVSSGSYGGGDRPNFVANINSSKDATTGNATHTAKEWFDVYAIGPRAAGTFGNSKPYSAIGPGWDEIDMTIGRTFPVTERANVEFKVDGFNIANHPNYQNPSGAFTGSYTSGGFGTITAANNMREIQASLHITY
jgi:outer membrane receptor protein involved in Fe transport